MRYDDTDQARRYDAARAMPRETQRRSLEPLHWFEALALWKAAVFCEAIYGRYVRGELTSDDDRAARFETGVPLLADTAAAVIAAG